RHGEQGGGCDGQRDELPPLHGTAPTSVSSRRRLTGAPSAVLLVFGSRVPVHPGDSPMRLPVVLAVLARIIQTPRRKAAGWGLPAPLPQICGQSRLRRRTAPFPHLGKAPQRAIRRLSRKDGERVSGGGHAGARTLGDTNPGAASPMTAGLRSAAS